MRPYSLIACAALSLTATFSDAEQADVQERGYSGNPVINGWYADPQMRIYKGKYWIFPTYSAKYEQQTFLDAFSSDDLETWTHHKRVLDNSSVKWLRRALWAPDSIEKDGKYYLFFACNDTYPVDKKNGDMTPCAPTDPKYGGIGVAVADSPEGPYKDLIGKPLVDKFYNGAQPIDQYVLNTASTIICSTAVGDVATRSDSPTTSKASCRSTTETYTKTSPPKAIRKVRLSSSAKANGILCGRRATGRPRAIR